MVKLGDGRDAGCAGHQGRPGRADIVSQGETQPNPVTTTRRRPAAPDGEGPLIGRKSAYFFRWDVT